jgi:competence protein ComEC
MATIHFLNVKQGDCSVIQHNSKRVTVIDVCNARPLEPLEVRIARKVALIAFGETSNRKNYPENPITYLKERGINSVYRFILTHPDMDHMDGMKAFFDEFRPVVFWDTENKAEKDFKGGFGFDEDDWKFYKRLRDGNSQANPKRLTLTSGKRGQHFNRGADIGGGDGLHILAPSAALVKDACKTGDYNDCSYVILYKTGDYKVVFGGDSHDKTWDHILSKHKSTVTNIDLLIAPHHGRDSGRCYDFLDVLKPTLTFFGNANSEHLAYDQWRKRNLPTLTNSQAGSIMADFDNGLMHVYVTYKPFAEKLNSGAAYNTRFNAYYIRSY